MKALVIADNEKVIKRIDSTLKKFGYDTIVYRWLLKALDNIEEISPHLIVISTEDYPRHWKTLTQFSGWTKNTENSNGTESFGVVQFPQVMLMVGKNFSAEEEDKAKTLNVAGIFKAVESDGEYGDYSELAAILSNLSEKLGNNTQPVSQIKNEPELDNNQAEIKVKEEEEEEETNINLPCSFVFTNPITLALVYGTARNYNGKTLEFTPDIPDFTKTLSEGTSINMASLRVTRDENEASSDSIKAVTASIISNDSEKLVVKITA